MTVTADRALYSIFDTMAMLSMSRSVIYEQTGRVGFTSSTKVAGAM